MLHRASGSPRGWERQLDIAYDPLFYQAGPLTPTEYRTWLLANGVSFVALADAQLDYAATAEAGLLRSGEVKGLRAVWHTASWQLWTVVGSHGLATGPATVVALSPARSRCGTRTPAPARSGCDGHPFGRLPALRLEKPAWPSGGWLDRAQFVGYRAAPGHHVGRQRKPWQLSSPGRRTIGLDQPMTDA